MLRVFLVPLHSFQPLIVLPIIKNHIKIIMLGNNEEIIIALSEFLIWENVAIREKENRCISFRDKPLHRRSGAWSAAYM